MIQITEIRDTKAGRFALFTEDGFWLSIDEETLLSKDIHKDCVLSEQEAIEIKEASDTRKAKNQALRFLAIRPHSQQELYVKLCRKHDEYSAAAAMAAMVELQLLDDTQFAQERAAALVQKGKSKRAIFYALQEQGIDRSLANDVVEALELDETELAIQWIKKNYLGKLRMGKQQAVMASLARRGFSNQNIKEALEQVQYEQEIE